MVSPMKVQDEPNYLLWLATRVGKMLLSYPLKTTLFIPQENNVFFSLKLNRSFIDQACLVKMAGYWSCSFLDVYKP